MRIETRIYDDKTVIPSVYLKKFDLKDDDIVIWDKKETGELIVKFKKITD